VSNYRVRQVLALHGLSQRRLRLYTAIATFLTDDSRTVEAGFEVIVKVTGNAATTVRAARNDGQKSGELTWQPGRGRGHLTTWTLQCLPEKGVNEVGTFSADAEPGKGTNSESEKVPTEAEKRYQLQLADLPTSDSGLNRCAKSSGSPPRRAPTGGANGEPLNVTAVIADLRHKMGWQAPDGPPQLEPFDWFAKQAEPEAAP
jgi:hypothetical protein